MKKTIIYLMMAALMVSCAESEFLNEGDFFYLKYKGADMPVWVKGNPNSDVMIITLHGGPGDAGMSFTINRGFELLEKDYLMVYWDQRFSGMTQGHYDHSLMTPDQFIEDTEKIVDLVLQKYPGKSFFLMGHSWGGQLAAGYLGRNNHQDAFRGWIDLNGAIYGELESQLMKEWILDRVPAKLVEPDSDIEFWQWIVDYYEENPAPGNYSAYEPYFYVSALRGDAYNWEETLNVNPIPYNTLVFKSMFTFSYYVYGFGHQKDMEKWDVLDYTPELGNITIPSLMLWGADDGVVPPGVADYVYENLATAPTDKKVVKIPECGHAPFWDQPERFFEEVSLFVENYK